MKVLYKFMCFLIARISFLKCHDLWNPHFLTGLYELTFEIRNREGNRNQHYLFLYCELSENKWG